MPCCVTFQGDKCKYVSMCRTVVSYHNQTDSWLLLTSSASSCRPASKCRNGQAAGPGQGRCSTGRGLAGRSGGAVRQQVVLIGRTASLTQNSGLHSSNLRCKECFLPHGATHTAPERSCALLCCCYWWGGVSSCFHVRAAPGADLIIGDAASFVEISNSPGQSSDLLHPCPLFTSVRLTFYEKHTFS